MVQFIPSKIGKTNFEKENIDKFIDKSDKKRRYD